LGLNGSIWQLTGEECYTEKLYGLHNSPTVIWGIKSRAVGWEWHAESMEARSVATGIS